MEIKDGTRAGAAYGSLPDQEKDGAEDMSVLAWMAPVSPSPDVFRDPGRRPIHLLKSPVMIWDPSPRSSCNNNRFTSHQEVFGASLVTCTSNQAPAGVRGRYTNSRGRSSPQESSVMRTRPRDAVGSRRSHRSGHSYVL
ncbi:hypothetical protein D4764_06G0012190 [Takifugu flavidus]|uniref:Uncharacterized protein n=1 Tax=Takifugu flavidus TaxID=433684 RepID=A0A5C6MY67_9TELE|nr:hypothetical protein D4764_06G0012190 [Takifugu flavidus]